MHGSIHEAQFVEKLVDFGAAVGVLLLEGNHEVAIIFGVNFNVVHLVGLIVHVLGLMGQLNVPLDSAD
jgi:hypothetical protein